MAVKRIADFYPTFLRTSRQVLLLTQLLILLLGVTIFVVLWQLVPLQTSEALAIGIGTFALIELAVPFFVLKTATDPLRVVTQAVNHISTQATDLPPPTINMAKYEKSGLKQIVQTIYDVALNAPSVPNAVPTSGNTEVRSS